MSVHDELDGATTPARVVYLSAAAAVEDPGICEGREKILLEPLCAPAVNPLCFHITHGVVQWRGKLVDCLFIAYCILHAPVLTWEWVMQAAA